MSDPVEIVIPTAGRPSLAALLASLAACGGPRPGRVVVVDDRRSDGPPLHFGSRSWVDDRLFVVRGAGAGPAAARNVGWRMAKAEWVAFLDDDVLVPPRWLQELAEDLANAGPEVWGSQGRVVVPLPPDRRPTDWERATAGLQDARWATADMAYRRSALERVNGFDERFPRAYREDADIALRMQEAGGALLRGHRHVEHPVRPAGPLVSLRRQAGNVDDVRMLALHGRGWRQRAEAPAGRAPVHAAVSALGLGALAAAVAGRRGTALLAGAAWAAATAELAAARIAPGPRTASEVATMVATSLAMPPIATAHRLRALAGLALRGRPGAWA